jgi:general secretion pathway protein C
MDLSGTQARPPGTLPTAHWFEQVERWISRRWVPVLVNLLVLVLLSHSLAQGTWRLLTPANERDASSVVGATDNPGEYNLQSLLSANLFGRVTAEAKPAVALDTIPPSKLSLVLTGVMVTPAGSFALISADGGPEAPFSVGQEISTNVTLYSVYSDRVLIRRGAAVESLMLKDAAQSLPGGVTPNPVANSRIGIQRNSNNSFTISRDQLTQQMQTPEFLTQALMVPNAGGGFLVREIQPGSVYEKLGLRVGDVIKTVNGQPVNSVEDVMRLYAQFGSASNVQIDVRRGGRDESLTYNIQ